MTKMVFNVQRFFYMAVCRLLLFAAYRPHRIKQNCPPWWPYKRAHQQAGAEGFHVAHHSSPRLIGEVGSNHIHTIQTAPPSTSPMPKPRTSGAFRKCSISHIRLAPILAAQAIHIAACLFLRPSRERQQQHLPHWQRQDCLIRINQLPNVVRSVCHYRRPRHYR